VSVGVDTGCGEHMHQHYPAALADLHGQGVGREEGVGPLVEGSAPEVGDLLVQLSGHHTDLRLR
jgi:hypothetical protein